MTVEWEKLPKKDLDHHLECSAWSNRFTSSECMQHFVSTISNGSETAHKCTTHECDIPYGEGKMQKIDLYLPKHQTEDSPVLIFFHGGYWQETSKEQYGFVAIQPAKYGAIVAVVGYTLAPMGTLPHMMNEVEQAILFLAQKFPKARGFYLSGHSAGGQLGAMMLSVDWSKKYGLPRDFITGACLLSGVFDVRPIAKSFVNDPLHLTDEEAYQASPITTDNLSEAVRLGPHCRIINICGEHDPPMFIQMTKDYTKELAAGGLNATHEVIPGMDHFEPTERLADAEHSVTKILLRMMSLGENT